MNTSGIRMMAVLPVALLLAATAQAQIGGGWTSMTIGGFLDYEVSDKHFQHDLTSFALPSVYYTNMSGSETFGLTTSGSNRAEHDTDSHYTSGSRQFQGDLQIFSGISDQSTVQIFNAPASGPILMLKAYGSNNGKLEKQGGSVVVAQNCFGQTERVNIIHDLNANTLTLYINGSQVWSGGGGLGGSFNFKYGLYGSFNSVTHTVWSNVKMWQGGSISGGGDFSITTTPSSQSVAPGDGANYTVTIGALSGSGTNVNLSASGLPGGAAANFSPATVTNSGNSTLTISTSGSTPIGSYPISIIGTSGSLAHTNTVTLIVSGFTLSATPSAQTVGAGGSTNFTVTVMTNSTFTGNIAFGFSGLPSDETVIFNPTILNQSGSLTLTIQTTTNDASGSYPVTINATNGGLVLSTSVTLIINGGAANPGVIFWMHGGADMNWSTILNWTNPVAGGNGPPGIANSLVFTNVGALNASALTSPGSGVVNPANINSTINGNFSVINLTNFANAINTSPNYQNLGIASGATLTVGNNLQVGGAGVYDFGANNVVNMSVSGAGATLLVTNGGITVCQGSGSSGAHDATLDLSGLDNLIVNASQIKMGVENVTRSGGIMYLAKTNTLTLSSAGYTNTDGSGSPYSGSPALTIGHNKTATGNGAQLYLGISNNIAIDYVSVGRGDANDLMEFNPAFTNQNPSVFINGTNGSSSLVGVYVVGDDSPGAGSSASGINDFSGGTVNASINYLCVGRGREGANDTGTSSGVLTFGTGSINANTLAVGFLYPSGSNSVVNGTVNVNGSSTLTVMTNITLATRPNSGHGSVQGTLNINGGTVEATNIVGGGGTAVINLNSGTIDLQPDWAATSGTISNISTLNVGANGASNSAVLIDVAQIFTTNTLTIASNGSIFGNIVISTPALIVNGSISPGDDGAGAMTNTGAITFGAGGSYAVTIDDAAAGPVEGWSFLQSGGGINIQSTAGNPFIIDAGTAGNLAANFNSNSNYDWVIATANNGITNFATNEFVINSSQFQNDLGSGYFYIHTNNNSIVLSFANNLPPVASPVAINISSGSGNNFIFSGANGNAGAQYYVLASTNLALPPAQWTVIATNNFDENGNFNFTNPADPNASQTFYLLRLQ